MATYLEFTTDTPQVGESPARRALVAAWANRDDTILPANVIQKALEWAAQRAFRELRIPELEKTYRHTILATEIEDQSRQTYFQYLDITVPSDLIELIYITRLSDGLVYNARLDNRSLIDEYGDRLIDSFTRIGNIYRLYGRFNIGDIIDIHYYGSFDVNSMGPVQRTETITDEVTIANWLDPDRLIPDPDSYREKLTSSVLVSSPSVAIYFPDETPSASIIDRTATNPSLSFDSNTHTTAMTFAPGTRTVTTTSIGPVQNYLLDQEQVLLYGALQEVFNYLDEPDTMARYAGLFNEEIMKLNMEEKKRKAMGGNIQVSYSGIGYL